MGAGRPGLGLFFQLILLAGMLAGCAPDFAASPNAIALKGTARSGAEISDTAFTAEDGRKLHARIWQPVDQTGDLTRPRAVIVALHGMNDYSNAFAMPAAAWAADGILTFAYDQRGFGANDDEGRWPGSTSFCQDLATAIRLVKARWQHVPVFALGESMGGAVVLDTMGGKTGVPVPKVDGIILAAPAVWARETMPVSYRILLWLASRLMPGVSFTGAGLHIQASDNIPMLIALGRDPLYIRRTRTDTIYGLVDLMDEAYAARLDRHIPTLLLYGARDQIIEKTPMRDFLAKATQEDPELKIAYYANGWHLLLRDLQFRAVASDVAHWITAPDQPLPSGADRASRALTAGLAAGGSSMEGRS